MGKNVSEQVASGERFGLFLGPTGSDRFLPSTAPSSFRGEVVLAAEEGGSPSGVGLELHGLGLTSMGLLTDSGATGKLGVQLNSGGGRLSRVADRRWRIEVEIFAKVLYRAIEESLGFTEVRPGIWMPSFESFLGTLTADLMEEDAGYLPNRLVPVPGVGSLNLRYQEGGLGWIRELVIPVADLALWSSAALPAPLSCPPDRKSQMRTLKVRPIGLKNGPADPFPTGIYSWQWQHISAKRIWRECCVELEAPDSPERIDVGNLKSSTDPAKLKQAVPSTHPDEIQVFIVDAMPPHGGGSIASCGSNLAVVVITDQSTANVNLLAHELGHALGLDDSNVGASLVGCPAGATGSVMDPSGSASHPNPSFNKLGNCRHVNPALVFGMPCCFTAT